MHCETDSALSEAKSVPQVSPSYLGSLGFGPVLIVSFGNLFDVSPRLIFAPNTIVIG